MKLGYCSSYKIFTNIMLRLEEGGRGNYLCVCNCKCFQYVCS